MFVAIASFPEVPTDRRDEFHAWFAWSNAQLRGTDGLEGRRLLRTTEGTYVALVEHQSAETFAAMHATEQATRVQARLAEILTASPRAAKYEVVAELPASGSCCGGGGHGHPQKAAAVERAGLQVAGRCCHDS
ncbi:antibiotic biosynthesis monooxygenase family protein [Pengzhenrongella phosphoraccumulans]|uniref:antibiotic biosynthesis monooxygenase family protein n=1 Tax=Pengzhenrongella phosphoraccumulans TaxID=3114394 RepID=UPI00388F3B60